MENILDLVDVGDQLLLHFGALGLLAYVALFVIAFSDSLIVTGTFTNGVAFLLLAGALAGGGGYNVAGFVLMAFLGSVLGSVVSYHLGRHSAAVLKASNDTTEQVQASRSKRLLHRYGAPAIILGRFLGPVSSVISFVAGTMQLSARTFIGGTLVASLLYAMVYVYFGAAVTEWLMI